jgi:NADPH2 dehydrogenase
MDGGVLVSPHLAEPFTLKDLSLKNRIVMSPMCQYSVWAEDGVLNAWHHDHYVSRAVGGAGLIVVEMTDVHPDGRITVKDSGIWDDAQIPPLRRIADEVHGYGAAFGIQIAHAGRKAESPSLRPVGPSAIPFSADYRTPHALTTGEVEEVVEQFAQGARRAVKAGVDVIELHGAHGYLLHQFMSPASNRREDRYGDPTEFPRQVIRAVKAEIPSGMPLFMRVSATEWSPEGYGLPELIEMCRAFQAAGVDLFDVSAGGNLPVRPPEGEYPGYMVGMATRIRQALVMPVMAVGRLEDPALAEAVVASRQADLVAVGRGMLRDPYWANTAIMALGGTTLLPAQYFRAVPPDRRDQRKPSGH